MKNQMTTHNTTITIGTDCISTTNKGLNTKTESKTNTNSLTSNESPSLIQLEKNNTYHQGWKELAEDRYSGWWM
tara:strand:- start:189 stop:410 length:222 start_codon:yes stop_codon:yes gene_type:complete